MEIEGKVALVTGAASGIGRATAIALADAGAAVVIADIDECGARDSQRIIEDAGGRAAFLKTDVTRQQDIERMIAFADERSAPSTSTPASTAAGLDSLPPITTKANQQAYYRASGSLI
jgi:NAD(P)-dependent dehydrogenase (short-subunit alcohol dehydrogenase family)